MEKGCLARKVKEMGGKRREKFGKEKGWVVVTKGWSL